MRRSRLTFSSSFSSARLPLSFAAASSSSADPPPFAFHRRPSCRRLSPRIFLSFVEVGSAWCAAARRMACVLRLASRRIRRASWKERRGRPLRRPRFGSARRLRLRPLGGRNRRRMLVRTRPSTVRTPPRARGRRPNRLGPLRLRRPPIRSRPTDFAKLGSYRRGRGGAARLACDARARLLPRGRTRTFRRMGNGGRIAGRPGPAPSPAPAPDRPDDTCAPVRCACACVPASCARRT
mmetsp:Transcript_7628/g.47084  ORF Transcript_7628/g.47084 Transcript_7628/m.47084 type:complete len:237 (-) Transcript_7628:293-1003(-)